MKERKEKAQSGGAAVSKFAALAKASAEGLNKSKMQKKTPEDHDKEAALDRKLDAYAKKMVGKTVKSMREQIDKDKKANERKRAFLMEKLEEKAGHLHTGPGKKFFDRAAEANLNIQGGLFQMKLIEAAKKGADVGKRDPLELELEAIEEQKRLDKIEKEKQKWKRYYEEGKMPS